MPHLMIKYSRMLSKYREKIVFYQHEHKVVVRAFLLIIDSNGVQQ